VTSTNDVDALEPIERDLQAAFAAPVPALRFAAGHAEDPRKQAMLRRRPVRLGLGVAVVTGALVATLVWLPAIGGGGTATVNARELIDRAGHANAAMAAVAPAYHLTTVVRVNGVTARTETWFAGATGARTETTSPMDGVEVTSGMATFSGELWLYESTGARTVVAHLAHADRQVLAETPSLASVLNSYAIPGCLEATVAREAMVVGRPAYVIEVRPTPATCVADPSNRDTIKVAGHAEELGSATVSIDKETDVTLALEQRDASGEVTYSYHVEALETGAVAAGAGLPYVAPVGARVVEAADYSAAKDVIAAANPASGVPNR
jgi:hypothetical protein